MAITPRCDRCRRELEFSGGLAYSPPVNGMCLKMHLCGKCWRAFQRWMTRSGPKPCAKRHRWGPWQAASEAPVAVMGCLKQKSFCKNCGQERNRQYDID
jgi:hypothetical protein